MRLRIFILTGLMFSLLFGCTIKHQVKGEYYLYSEKYKQGIADFREELVEHGDDPNANFYLGRFYLAEGKYKKGLHFIKRAVVLNPHNSDYYFWLGIAHAANKDRNLERSNYLKALEIKSNHVQALTYLGHNYFESGEFKKALKTYDRVLGIWPKNTSALFNRAVILKHFKRTPEEKLAWKGYLAVTASGAKARQAAENLNAIGDFDYRNHLIGRRNITLKKIAFNPSTPVIEKDSQRALDVLGSILENNDRIVLHVVAYQKNNQDLAEGRARAVKAYLIKKYPKIHSARLRLSWFGVSENIAVKGKSNKSRQVYKVDESVNFITAIDGKKDKALVGSRK